MLSVCLHYNLASYVTENIGQNLKFTLIQAACQSQGLAYAEKSEHYLPCQNQCLSWGTFSHPKGERGLQLPDSLCPVSRSPVYPVVVVEVLLSHTLWNPGMSQDTTAGVGFTSADLRGHTPSISQHSGSLNLHRSMGAWEPGRAGPDLNSLSSSPFVLLCPW